MELKFPEPYEAVLFMEILKKNSIQPKFLRPRIERAN